jgi:23S rRNA pseudouridine2605 synthase
MERTERLQRVMAARGAGSRRGAEEAIRAGRVMVNGERVTDLGVKVDPLAAEIRLDGKLLRPQRLRTIVLNKPSGYITTTKDERGRRTVMDLVQVPERVYPVGRLDRDTQGLLILTNDGDVANRVMHPRYQLDKEYHVLTLARPHERALQRLRDGVVVEGKKVVPEEVRILRETREGLILKVVLHQGMYHVVRSMMETVGIPVDRLRRVRIGPLSINGISVGAWRDLTPGELHQLHQALHLDRDDDEIERLAVGIGRTSRRPAPADQSATRGAAGKSGKPGPKPPRRSRPQIGPHPPRPRRAPAATAATERRDDRRASDDHGGAPERDDRRGRHAPDRSGSGRDERGRGPGQSPGRPPVQYRSGERDEGRGDATHADQRFDDRRGGRPRRAGRHHQPPPIRGRGRGLPGRSSDRGATGRGFDRADDRDRDGDPVERDRRPDGERPPAGGRDRRGRGGRQDDRRPAPRRPDRRDAL